MADMDQKNSLPVRFPKKFLWGAATSAHQVEGGNHNQWSVWELENAKSLAHQAEYKLCDLPVWPEIREQATNPDNYISGRAVDHYNLYEKDFDIVKAMNMNAFRFSIEWSRLEPEEGKWNVKEIQHYKDYIAALKVRGIEPLLTLYHWTVPVWFAEKGGFEKASNIRHFVHFAEKVLQELGQDVRYITTINEPDTVVGMGYFTLEHPPQKKSLFKMVVTYRNLLLAHKRVYRMGRKMSRKFKIGFVRTYAHFYRGDDSWKSKLAVRVALLLDSLTFRYVGRKLDFIGVNYYFSDKFEGFKLVNPNDHPNDLGWDMQPQNLEKVLRRLGKRKVPIIVTESGVADMNDKHRKWWITHSLIGIHRAIDRGVPVIGYVHWSLLDNFEWAAGKWPRFGLIEVDYKTMKRKPRESAKWYAKVLKQIRGV